MLNEYRRTGDLKTIGSYPVWMQRMVRETAPYKKRVVEHELFAKMRHAKLPATVMRRFLIGGWPTIEQFPRFMSMNLKKVGYGNSAGEDLARRYLIHNIRVEQKHAEHWAAWAASAGVSLRDLQSAVNLEGSQALAHWCWYVCDQADIAVAMAATNYAVEGATGEWSCLVCSLDSYAQSLPEAVRPRAMRWLNMHAEYDDTHPWEALEIIASLLGHAPSPQRIAEVRQAVQSSYVYMEMGLNDAMMAGLHGSFEDSASNSSTLDSMPGMLDVA